MVHDCMQQGLAASELVTKAIYDTNLVVRRRKEAEISFKVACKKYHVYQSDMSLWGLCDLIKTPSMPDFVHAILTMIMM